MPLEPTPDGPTSPSVRTDLVLLLGGLSALTALSIDIILPATGVIARDLGKAPEKGALLIGSYFLAYGVGQLFWGLFSDAYGRIPALRLSLTGFLIATLLCTLATSFWLLVALRALQGLMGGAPAIARAMARDLGTGETAARLFATILSVMSVAPLIAPVMGAGLLALFGWRACFLFLTLVAIILLVLLWQIARETVPEKRPERLSLGFLSSAFPQLMMKPPFVAGLMVSSLTFAGYSSILGMGAVVMDEAYGLSPAEFSAVFVLGAAAVIAGSSLVRVLIPRIGLAGIGTVAACALALAVAVQVIFWVTEPSLTVFWSGAILFYLAFGLVLPSSHAMAMEPAADMAGFASSVLGAALMVFGAAGAGLATLLHDGSHIALSATMTIGGGLALVSHLVLGRRAGQGAVP